MTANSTLPDYYAVLQVHPDADDEVIAAAYRQLMKKYHPDVAGSDPIRLADHAARAKAINEAFGVLRDTERRRQYDSARIFFGTYRAHAESPPPASPRRPPVAPSPPIDLPPEPRGPAHWLTALYYLLPGAYEWENGQNAELITVVILPVVTVLGYALVTDRLAPWIGATLQAQLIMAGLLVLMALPLLWSLPRVALAVGPSAVALTGIANPMLAQAHLPGWFVWPVASLVSLLLSARLFVFGVVPALLCCWAISAFQWR